MNQYTPQELQCLKMFRDNDGFVTTGMFLKSTLSAEYRKIISNLRKKGFEIPAPILNREQPGSNQYRLIEGTPQEQEPIRQVSSPCQAQIIKGGTCMSYYRRGNECNRKEFHVR